MSPFFSLRRHGRVSDDISPSKDEIVLLQKAGLGKGKLFSLIRMQIMMVL